MGFVSFQCAGCPHPLLNLYDQQVHAGNQWMRRGVVIRPDGSMIFGTYDGYARLIEDESDVEQEMFTDADDYGDLVSTVWHHACWVAAGCPPEHRGKSPQADDQGWFYGMGDHDMAEPTKPAGIFDPTMLLIDGDLALAEQDDKSWKVYQRDSDDDQHWTEVARAENYFDAIAERDKRMTDDEVVDWGDRTFGELTAQEKVNAARSACRQLETELNGNADAISAALTLEPEVGDRVLVGTRGGAVAGNVVSITRAGTVAIQLNGYADLVYRKPKNITVIAKAS